jgi:hypothetical protein
MTEIITSFLSDWIAKGNFGDHLLGFENYSRREKESRWRERVHLP